jgi:hypothetical protein
MSKFDAEQDDLYERMFGSRSASSVPEHQEPQAIRAAQGLTFGEVKAKYPRKSDRDELAIALRLERAGAGVQLADEERPFAERIVADEEYRVELSATAEEAMGLKRRHAAQRLDLDLDD